MITEKTEKYIKIQPWKEMLISQTSLFISKNIQYIRSTCKSYEGFTCVIQNPFKKLGDATQ